MAKFNTQITDRIKEYRVEFEDKESLHAAFKIVLDEMKSRDTNIMDVYKGLLCEYGDRILFDNSKALYVICTPIDFDALTERWEEEV